MRKLILLLGLVATALTPMKARASLFGEEDIILGEILANAIQQLEQMEHIFGVGKDNLDFMRSIHRGINDSLYLLRTIGPYTDPGIYKDARSVAQAIRKIQEVYGIVVDSRDATIQRDSDEGVAEAIALNNQIYDYTAKIDVIGEAVKDASHRVSPGGADKLSAQTLGVMLNVMNQSLRTQATGLKLQAQAFAVQNRRDKEQSKHFLTTKAELKSAMQTTAPTFTIPRF